MKVIVFFAVLSVFALGGTSGQQFNPFAFLTNLIQSQISSTSKLISQFGSNVEQSLIPLFANANATINNASLSIAAFAYKVGQCTAREQNPNLPNEILLKLSECFTNGAAEGGGLTQNFVTQVFEPTKNFLLGIPSQLQECRKAYSNDTQKENECITSVSNQAFQKSLSLSSTAARNGLQTAIFSATAPINVQACLAARTTGYAIRIGQLGSNVTNCVFSQG